MPTPKQPRRPDPEPLDVDAVLVVVIGTALWVVALVVLLALKSTLDRHDAGWWVWVCVAGIALGLIGLVVTTRQRSRRRAAEPVEPPPAVASRDRPRG